MIPQPRSAPAAAGGGVPADGRAGEAAGQVVEMRMRKSVTGKIGLKYGKMVGKNGFRGKPL